MTFVMVDRRSDPHHHSSLFFTPSEASHGGLDLERKWRGPPAAQTAARRMVRQSCVFRFSEIEQLLHCRNQVPAFSSFPLPRQARWAAAHALRLEFSQGCPNFRHGFRGEGIDGLDHPSGRVLIRA
ncbi:hypothetical protein HA464_18485 [Rhizobium leguminosarum bv. trifolii]|jgi:hypothetical protein|uniref:hypothetical protein n=1 Tax=Rhizobium ruizarguesonis TaxID=2081791 RepID=UPI0013D5137D|nr:hypothetical protein [Rhizobium ruizarguesonis]MBY5804461.1 hypothetical protein [Rhizobium leguminosarum]QIO42510.1 hypothetical protein HA464_18485 [Rhizobium leguminosarum bv. trifolii]MBY5844732.1 hypothetical protein [Rhizobium leguminosarum]MBY5881480.1 hypothetical protein [Rhizobium leguminosarum]MBY5885338.1 hypothetical protein [Rhizobium leguminosarum]